jgi:hypothetical protein
VETTINLLDVVALNEDIREKGLQRGNVGTVVELLDNGYYEVEFVDDNGQTYALLAIPADKLIVLHYQPANFARAV